MAKKEKKSATVSDAPARIKELEEKLRIIRFAMAGSQSKNVKESKTYRHEIARLKTAIHAAK